MQFTGGMKPGPIEVGSHGSPFCCGDENAPLKFGHFSISLLGPQKP